MPRGDGSFPALRPSLSPVPPVLLGAAPNCFILGIFQSSLCQTRRPSCNTYPTTCSWPFCSYFPQIPGLGSPSSMPRFHET